MNNGKKLAEITDEKTKMVIEQLRPEVVRFTEHNPIRCNNKNIEALLNEIENALNSGKNSVVAKYREIKPKINVQDIKKETNFRVSFTTNYSYSNIDRKYNIQLASKKINGIILDNGEEFSFNKIVGLRTEENGFKNAKVIFNGDYVDGVGGGVCQVSTTLYNTALLSGLLITEHHPHSLQVSYVEPSFDAMVNSVSSDLKFINNTGGRLYIKSVADFNNLTISFYGIKQNEKYDRVSVVVEETACNEYLYEDDNDINFGDKVIVRIPKNGISSEGYLIKYENGVEIKNSRIRCDYYNPIKGIIKVGKKLTN